MPDNDHGGPFGPKRIHGHYDYRRPSGEIPVPRHLRGWEKYQAIGRPMTYDEWKEANDMNFDPNLSAFHHALATGQHAAGHVSSEEAEKAEREMHAQAIDLEKAAREAAEKQAEIDRRLKAAMDGTARSVLTPESEDSGAREAVAVETATDATAE